MKNMNNPSEKIQKDFINNLKNYSDNPTDDNLYRFEKICYTTFYDFLMKGFIYEKEDIIIALDFFLRDNDTKKIENCVNILEKYYTGHIKDYFETLIKNEEYEKCEYWKNILN